MSCKFVRSRIDIRQIASSLFRSFAQSGSNINTMRFHHLIRRFGNRFDFNAAYVSLDKVRSESNDELVIKMIINSESSPSDAVHRERRVCDFEIISRQRRYRQSCRIFIVKSFDRRHIARRHAISRGSVHADQILSRLVCLTMSVFFHL